MDHRKRKLPNLKRETESDEKGFNFLGTREEEKKYKKEAES